MAVCNSKIFIFRKKILNLGRGQRGTTEYVQKSGGEKQSNIKLHEQQKALFLFKISLPSSRITAAVAAPAAEVLKTCFLFTLSKKETIYTANAIQ